MTTDRDIRLSVGQMYYLDKLVRKRLRELNKKIDTAKANAAEGQKIQRGVLGEHVTERGELLLVQESMRVAVEQIKRQITQRVLAGREQR